MTMLWRQTLILTSLGIIAVGALALVGFWHPTMPMETVQTFVPKVTLPAVIIAGAADGINPCAFTVLLLFISAVLASAQTGAEVSKAVRTRLLGMGAIYIGAVFLTYLGLGVGLLRSFSFIAQRHLPARLGALFAILFGLWMVKDFFLPELGWKLQAPGKIGDVARQAARKATVPALIGSGFLIGLCTVPCSGAIYLGILGLLTMQPTTLLGYSYLVLYNIVFVLPLVIILLAASARPTLSRLVHWNNHHKEWVRLALGSGVVAMGLFVLAAV